MSYENTTSATRTLNTAKFPPLSLVIIMFSFSLFDDPLNSRASWFGFSKTGLTQSQ